MSGISFFVFTGIGYAFLPRNTVEFFGGLSGGDTRTASPLYVGNQSLLGVFYRLVDTYGLHRPASLFALCEAQGVQAGLAQLRRHEAQERRLERPRTRWMPRRTPSVLLSRSTSRPAGVPAGDAYSQSCSRA